MNAWRRNKLITIQQKTETSDGQGGQTVAWSTRAREWGAVEPLPRSASEGVQASSVTATQGVQITILYRDDVVATDRVTVEGRTLQISGLMDLSGTRDELVLHCAEVTA